MLFIERKELQFDVIYESLENVIKCFYKMSYMILKCKGDVIAAYKNKSINDTTWKYEYLFN